MWHHATVHVDMFQHETADRTPPPPAPPLGTDGFLYAKQGAVSLVPLQGCLTFLPVAFALKKKHHLG